MTAEPSVWIDPAASPQEQLNTLLARRAEAVARVALADREIRDANDRKRRAHEIWHDTDARIMSLCASQDLPMPEPLIAPEER